MGALAGIEAKTRDRFGCMVELFADECIEQLRQLPGSAASRCSGRVLGSRYGRRWHSGQCRRRGPAHQQIPAVEHARLRVVVKSLMSAWQGDKFRGRWRLGDGLQLAV